MKSCEGIFLPRTYRSCRTQSMIHQSDVVAFSASLRQSVAVRGASELYLRAFSGRPHKRPSSLTSTISIPLTVCGGLFSIELSRTFRFGVSRCGPCARRRRDGTMCFPREIRSIFRRLPEYCKHTCHLILGEVLSSSRACGACGAWAARVRRHAPISSSSADENARKNSGPTWSRCGDTSARSRRHACN